MASKFYVTPEELRIQSYALAAQVVESRRTPDIIVPLWRGGSSVGCYLHEFLKYTINYKGDHFCIKTSRYTGLDEALSEVQVHNIRYLADKLDPNVKLLIVDDVLDTGLSVDAVFVELRNILCEYMPREVRVATVFYKPTRNKTNRIPDYYVEETDKWIVFPHELEGLTMEEICDGMGQEIADIIDSVSQAPEVCPNECT